MASISWAPSATDREVLDTLSAAAIDDFAGNHSSAGFLLDRVRAERRHLVGVVLDEWLRVIGEKRQQKLPRAFMGDDFWKSFYGAAASSWLIGLASRLSEGVVRDADASKFLIDLLELQLQEINGVGSPVGLLNHWLDAGLRLATRLDESLDDGRLIGLLASSPCASPSYRLPIFVFECLPDTQVSGEIVVDRMSRIAQAWPHAARFYQNALAVLGQHEEDVPSCERELLTHLPRFIPDAVLDDVIRFVQNGYSGNPKSREIALTTLQKRLLEREAAIVPEGAARREQASKSRRAI